MNYLPRGGLVRSGRIVFDGKDLLKRGTRDMRQHLGQPDGDGASGPAFIVSIRRCESGTSFPRP